MKQDFRRIVTLGTLFVGLVITGCRHDPNPPTEQDAIAVWKNIHAKPHIEDLVSFKKTNGQLQTINGQRVYTLYYEAKEKSVVQVGTQPAGTIDSNQSNYPFQWTEKGWLGPDGQVYPEH